MPSNRFAHLHITVPHPSLLHLLFFPYSFLSLFSWFYFLPIFPLYPSSFHIILLPPSFSHLLLFSSSLYLLIPPTWISSFLFYFLISLFSLLLPFLSLPSFFFSFPSFLVVLASSFPSFNLFLPFASTFFSPFFSLSLPPFLPSFLPSFLHVSLSCFFTYFLLPFPNPFSSPFIFSFLHHSLSLAFFLHSSFPSHLLPPFLSFFVFLPSSSPFTCPSFILNFSLSPFKLIFYSLFLSIHLHSFPLPFYYICSLLAPFSTSFLFFLLSTFLLAFFLVRLILPFRKKTLWNSIFSA